MKKLILFLTLLAMVAWDSCVEKIDFSASNISQLVVEGMITDAPGPYTIRLTRTRKLSDLSKTQVVSAKSVLISDNLGNSELLREVDLGIFQTNTNGIRGIIGREYQVRIETRDGKVYESIPEKLNPTGTIENIYFKFEQEKPENGPTTSRFRIFIDSNGVPNKDISFRWKMTYTYQVETRPDLHFIKIGEAEIPDPRPCSGHVYSNGLVFYVGPPCNCCTCWVSYSDQKTRVSTNEISSGGNFRGIDMGTVPILYNFPPKVSVEVQQMSLSEKASNFWKTIEDQKNGGSSLFQPSIGRTVSNLYEKGGTETVLGYFFATSIEKKSIFLFPKDIPSGSIVIPSPPDLMKESCLLAFPNSTNQIPTNW